MPDFSQKALHLKSSFVRSIWAKGLRGFLAV